MVIMKLFSAVLPRPPDGIRLELCRCGVDRSHFAHDAAAVGYNSYRMAFVKLRGFGNRHEALTGWATRPRENVRRGELPASMSTLRGRKVKNRHTSFFPLSWTRWGPSGLHDPRIDRNERQTSQKDTLSLLEPFVRDDVLVLSAVRLPRRVPGYRVQVDRPLESGVGDV